MKKHFLIIALQLITLQITFAQFGFNISKEQDLKEWMNESARAGEFYSNQIPVVEKILNALKENPKDHDLNFNLAVELHMGLRQVFKSGLQTWKYQSSTKEIKKMVDLLYMFETDKESGTRRRDVMKGMMENDMGAYSMSLGYLEHALEDEEEGSKYWMMAADQYLFSGLKMNSSFRSDEMLVVYSKFQNYVSQSKDKNYTERLQMYIPYFEPKL